MQVITSPKLIQNLCLGLKKKGKAIAVVPTMGYLHAGHIKLMTKARKKADIVVLTIFVNPTQFGPKEDFKRYPRDKKGDLEKTRKAGVDFIFMPSAKVMYPKDYETYVEVTHATQELCGRSRPTHFRGVATIVLKLFNLIAPDYAVFGLKDHQQYAVLCRMVKDLNLPIQMIGVPTIREADGLALSSRNVYLDREERKQALSLSQGLFKVRANIKKGHTDLSQLIQILKKEITSKPLAHIDYIKCVDSQAIQPIKKYHPGKTLFAVAVFIGKTRLIDNLVI